MAGKNRDFESWWKERNLPVKILTVIGFTVLGLGLAALFGWIVMLLWNWIVPDTIGWKPITYWKAFGLFLLCMILFKGFGSSSTGNGRRTDRKRKEQLRSYMQEEPTGSGEPAMGTVSRTAPPEV